MEPRATRKPARRTQAERREATQTALLDATIECLVEYGYAGTTTVRIVERAGVSRGAQVHHYATKAELVAEAVRHLARKLAAEFVEEVGPRPPRGRKQFDTLLDRVWKLHRGSLFAAAMELFVAARTDPDLSSRLREVQHEINRTISVTLPDLLPEEARSRAFRDTLEMGLASMRGLAILGFVIDDEGVERRWKAVKRRILAAIPDGE